MNNKYLTKTNNMNKEFIPYEQILELKELGFNGILWQEAFRWFREKYDLVYSIMPESDSGHTLLTRTYNLFIHTFIMNVNVQSEILRVDGKIARYNSYEEAELACLKKLIEIAKNK